ncbi:ABC transporter ATP-binding protein [Pseudosporangium ferrugineum]|uniref:ABC transporter ATP-binding protein n=1 Tax=Pseudosporangium ferrugineum TaxID=439699 RepID=UPI001FECCE92|nr:ABC transporter ATP-binding protein [Pseudosporangium ferrugineum]
MNVDPIALPARSDPVLRIESLTYAIDDRILLNEVDLQVGAGESVTITGPSGSGKSTLLSCILGLLKPSSGRIVLSGQDLVRLRGRELARIRQRKIGMVFQFGELIPELTPLENVALPALLQRGNRRESYDKAAALLSELGVPSHGRTDRLSGGERQRTGVARALINSPAVILADEPTGALDAKTKDQVADMIFDLPRAYGCAVLVVTHDASVAERANHVVHLDGGVLATVRTPGLGGS